MTRKQRRLSMLVAGMLCLGAAAALVLTALEDNLLFFYSPTDLLANNPPSDRRLRVGGLVVPGSVAKESQGATVQFTLTDNANTVRVAYTGILPDLFREGQGIIAMGLLGGDGVFKADEVLAKHDETYMPKEVADAIKDTGQWKGREGQFR